MTLISIGELLVEFSRGDDGRFSAAYAGDAFNALYYAQRMGLECGFVSAVGSDLFTPMLLDGIDREGIDRSRLLHLDSRRNGLYFIELDERGEYTFHFWRADSAATETLLHHDVDELAHYIESSEYLLLTGVTLAVMKAPERLLELVQRVNGMTRVVLDSNYRARLWSSPADYRRRIEELLPFVDLFLPTEGDLIAAWPGEELSEIVKRVGAFGPRGIIVKAGERGCYLADGESLRAIPPPVHVEVVDATGAGDAFNAGVIAGFSRGMPPEQACDLGHRVAARSLAARGALTREFEGRDVWSS